MDILKDLNKTMEGLKKSQDAIMSKVMQPEILKHMTNEQKKFMKEGKDAFNLGDLNLAEKLENLTKTLKDVPNIN